MAKLLFGNTSPVEGKPDLASCNSCRRYYTFKGAQLPENLTQRAGQRNGDREEEVKYQQEFFDTNIFKY